ncbi:MAG: hypothetical protein RI949_1172 [Pseudomonadota bacterium]|nr:hypothetical protein [Betaproteobacteria bacterium]NBX05905.1 hypothetical protein [Betaproteobacteria bacterium]
MSVSADQRDAILLVGRLFALHGFADKGVRIVGALDVIHPDDPDTLRALAWTQSKATLPQQALSTLDRLAALGHIDQGFHLMRSQVLSQLDRYEEAAASMRAYLEGLDPKLPGVRVKSS